jgi:hypothetical protein
VAGSPASLHGWPRSFKHENRDHHAILAPENSKIELDGYEKTYKGWKLEFKIERVHVVYLVV